MKKITLKRICTIISAAAVSLVLTACSNIFDSGSKFETETKKKSSGDTVVIRLSLNDEARTAYPTVISFKSFSLVGVSADSSISDVEWHTNESEDAKKQLNSAEITVQKGATYTFTLTAETTSGSIYKDTTVPITVQENGTKLSFALTLVSLGGTGVQGNASIGVQLPKDGSVNKVTVSVYSVNDDATLANEPVSAALTDKVVPIVDGKAKFDSGNLSVGMYCAVFTLWSENEIKTSSVAVATWREYFVIAGGLTSTSTLNPNGDDLKTDKIYTITFHTYGGSEPAINEFSRNTNIQASVLRSTRRDGSFTTDWYFDEEFTQPFTSTSGIKKDIDLYAKWPKDVETFAIVTVEEPEEQYYAEEKYSMNYYTENEKYVFTVQTSIANPEVRWYVDGVLVSSDAGRTLEIPAEELSAGVHVVEAKTLYSGTEYSSSAEVDVLAEGEFYIDFAFDFEEGGLREDAQ